MTGARRVLLVDWLGRGGIAQTSEAWAMELAAAGAEVRVVTRAGREIGAGPVAVVGPTERSTAVLSHLALCRYAAREIRDWRPDAVVIQNYVLPVLEDQVHRAARRSGARVVFVVHDHRHHEWREGGHLGLERQIRSADIVVAHSGWVAAGLGRRDVTLAPLPVQLGMVDLVGTSPVVPPPDHLLALQFGILNRSYKGTGLGAELAAAGAPGWAFAFAGVGAPSCPGAQRVDRFLDPGELVAAVRASSAVLLPYRHATQSAAVVLAQVCGTVPVASAVGGVAEQIEHGTSGLLVEAGAGAAAWQAPLAALRDGEHRAQLQRGARDAVWQRHEEFRSVALAVTLAG